MVVSQNCALSRMQNPIPSHSSKSTFSMGKSLLNQVHNSPPVKVMVLWNNKAVG